MDTLLPLIGQFGFPMAIAIYLLVTRDRVIVKNTEAIEHLTFLIKMRLK